MAAYVDPLMNHGGSATFRWKDSCHLYADSLDELHAFAQKIGLKRAWFQDKRVPHYDLNPGRFKAAVSQGVVQHTRRQAVEFWCSKGWHSRKLVEMEFGKAEFPLTLHPDGTDSLFCRECGGGVYPSEGNFSIGDPCPSCQPSEPKESLFEGAN